MSTHEAVILWQFSGEDFRKGKFSRAHTWSFDGGAVVDAAASPHIVPPALTNAAGVDPEEAFVASIASCHMLTFVHLASRRGFEIARYEDHAVGTMTKNGRGVRWISQVVLDPQITYTGTPPTAEEATALHHAAHEECFIASSVKTEISVKGVA